MDALSDAICPLCGGANQCAPAMTGRLDIECWCTKAFIGAEVLEQVPEHLLNKACLCPRCAAGLKLSESE